MDLAYMAALPQEEFTERRQKVFAPIHEINKRIIQNRHRSFQQSYNGPS